MSNPYIILGSGGHAKVILNLLRKNNKHVICFADVDDSLTGKTLYDFNIINESEIMENYNPGSVNLALGLGVSSIKLIDGLASRLNVAKKFEDLGYYFPPTIHPDAIIPDDCVLKDGAQIMAGVVIQPGCNIGSHAIINTACSIDHDCTIGDGSHVGPGACLAGSISIDKHSYVGIGATIINNLSIGSEVVIGAGSVVINNVADNSSVVGNPAQAKH